MDLLAIGVLNLLLIASIFGVNFEPLRVALGVLAVLFFPGYLLAAVLYPQREDLLVVERVALSIGFSIAIVPILGMGLNLTPWGLRLDVMVGGLALWNLVVGFLAWYRRYNFPEWQRFDVPWSAVAAWLRTLRRPSAIAAHGVVALALVATVAMVTWKLQDPGPTQTFTEFYLLGHDGLAEDYPTTVKGGDTESIAVGIVNREGQPQTYTLRVVQGQTSIGTVGPVKLNDGEGWEGEVEFRPTTLQADTILEFQLIQEPGPAPLQRLKLPVHVQGAGETG